MKRENWDTIKGWSERLEQIFQTGRIPLNIIDYLRHQDPKNAYCWFPAQAVIKTINTLDGMDVDSWILLMRLINSSRFYREDIQEALLARFIACVPDATEARATVLRTLLNLGHRFWPIHLKKEYDIRDELPDLYAFAGKQSGHWEQYQLIMKGGESGKKEYP